MTGSRIPVISLYGTLIVPVQGTIGDELLENLRHDVTSRIEQEDARGLVIDISGVDLLDSYMTRCIRDLALVVKLMGVPTVVAGARSDVAITIVEMGLEIPGVATRLNLERALEYLVAITREDEDDDLFGLDDLDDVEDDFVGEMRRQG